MKGLPVAVRLGQVARASRAGEKKRHEGSWAKILGATQTHITEYSDEDNQPRGYLFKFKTSRVHLTKP